jgi:hypothetical protein
VRRAEADPLVRVLPPEAKNFSLQKIFEASSSYLNGLGVQKRPSENKNGNKDSFDRSVSLPGIKYEELAQISLARVKDCSSLADEPE